MKIPIQNIYYILCYAWNRLEEGKFVSVDQLDKNDVASLFGKVLASGTSHLIKKGLDRGYISHDDELSRLRGRINFDKTLKTNFFTKPSLVCDYDVLSYDILHNQIIKATIRNLFNCPKIKYEVRQELRDVYLRLHQISDINLYKKDFRLIQLNRNNSFYEFLINICEFIFDNLLISKEKGKSKFKDFIQNEVQMRSIFEEFVRNFYKKELGDDYEVNREDIQWDAIGSDEDKAFLPKMQTDISLERNNRKIIMDTKYYKETLSSHHNTEKIKSENLYQLFSYLMNAEAKGGNNIECEGILLYPTIDDDYSFDYFIKGHKVSIRTINLNQNWQGIHEDLIEIVNPTYQLITF